MPDKQQVNMLKAIRNLFGIIRLDKTEVSAIYFFAILGGLISLTLPLGIQTIISFVQAGSLSTSIVILIGIVVLAVFFNGLVQVRQMQVIEKVEQKIFTRYSLEFANKIPKLDIEKLDNYHLPELVNRYFDTVSLTKSIEKILLDIPTAIIQILFGLLLLSFYHPVFIAFGILLIAIVLIIVRFTSQQGLNTSFEASDQKYNIAAWLQEIASNIKTFKYNKGTHLPIEKTDHYVVGYLKSRSHHFKILLTQYWSFISFKIIITAAMLIIGSLLLVNQQINVGQFIAADIVIITIINSVEKLIGSLDKVYDILTSIEKLNKVVDAATETSGTLELPSKSTGVSIQFEQFYFTYANGKVALKDLNLTINPGDIVAIVGDPGSGKSTLLRVLTGAFKNFTGSILIDEIPLGNYKLSSLRSQTGILLNKQDVFRGTILENINMGNKLIDLKEIQELANITGTVEVVKQSPEGYNTLLQPQGKRLSETDRNNLLLIRALAGNSRLLLLENPFQNLNKEQRIALMEYLKTNKHATMVYTTTSQCASLPFCNKIVTLKDESIVDVKSL